jgi:hypothetical protein
MITNYHSLFKPKICLRKGVLGEFNIVFVVIKAFLTAIGLNTLA